MEARSLRRHWPLAALLVLLGVPAFALTWSELLADFGADSAIYVLSARHFAPYLPADPIARTFADGSVFPPLYPLLLALTGGALDLRLAHAVTTACLLLAFAAFHFNLLALGLPRRLALAGVAIFALMPETLVRALQLRSECLYLLLSLAGFAWLSRGAASGSARAFWIATALFALALLTRSVGIALLPALVVALLRARPRHWPWMPAAMLLPALAWAAQRSEQTYGGVAATVLQVPLASIVKLLTFNGTAFAWGLAGNLLQTQALAAVLVPLALVAAGVLVLRFARGEPDAWYVAGYTAIMVLWPYPEEAQRFAWVVMPWLLGYVVHGAHRAVRHLRSPVVAEAARWFVPAVLALLILPSVTYAVQRWAEPTDRALAHLPEWYLPAVADGQAKARVHLDMARAIAELAERVPPGECTYSITPAVAFYGGRPNYLVGEKRLGPAEFDAWTRRWGCRYFMLLSAWDGTIADEPFYPHRRLGERLEIVDVRYAEGDGPPQVVAMLAVLRETPG